MKTMRQKTSLLLVMLLILATSIWAQDVQVQAAAGQAYTISSTQNASAINAIRYQWFRNAAPIPGATGASYTVPAPYAYGDNVIFRRQAITSECAGATEVFSNSVTITFTGYATPIGCNLVVAGVCWANTNLLSQNIFAARADMRTPYFQWNRLTEYSPTDPLTPAWDNTTDPSPFWTVDPCPAPWHIPTNDQAIALVNTGHTWVDAGVRGTTMSGAFIGYNHATCSLSGDMQGCIFLPNTDLRAPNTGYLRNQNYAMSWTSQGATLTSAGSVYFYPTGRQMNPTSHGKNYALPIRCVQ